MNQLIGISAFVMLGEKEIHLGFSRRCPNGNRLYSQYTPSVETAHIVSEMIYELMLLGEWQVGPFLQSDPTAWGWNARLIES